MRIGIHTRTAGSMPGALTYAAGLGAECVQVFAKSPQQWRGRPLDPATTDEVRRLAEVLELPVYTHTAYLINLGSADDALWKRSIDALEDELRRGIALGALGVVTHIGTASFETLEEAVERIATGVELACGAAGEDADSLLLLENTAGGGTTFGGSFAELGALFDRLDGDGMRCGMCLDTCHAHAYGHDLSSAEAWRAAMDALERCCGAGRVKLVHANDCAFPLGSKRDRHAWIGDGAIGYRGFGAMVCEPRLADVPVVMEMPGETPDKDVINLERLKSARDACA